MSVESNQISARLRALFNSSFQAFLLVDTAYEISEYNDKADEWFLRVYGRSVRIGSSMLDYIPKDDLEDFRHGFSGAIEKKTTRTKLFSIVTGADNRDYWFEYQFYPVVDEEPVTSVYVGIIDITDRKIAVDEVALNSRRYHSLIKNSLDIVSILDESSVIRYINDSVEGILGYRPGQLEMKNIMDLLFPDDVLKFRNFFSSAVSKTGLSFITQFRLRHADGYWVFFEATGNNLLDEDSIRGIVLNLRDITDRRLIEEMFKKISRQNELILESAGEGIYGINNRGKINFANPAAAEMLGLTVESMIGIEHARVIQQFTPEGLPYPPDDMPYLASMRDGAMRTVGEVFFRRSDGALFPVEYITTPIREGSEIVGAVVIFNDISERKKAQEELLRAKEEAVLANRAKGDFLANMSHEIRTPINSILGFMELLGMTDLDDTQKEYLAISREGARNLLEIINDILDYSKIERGKVELERISFNPRLEFESALELFTVRAREKRIKFTAFIDPRLPNLVTADPLRIKQVLNNLISNALKFTPDDGSVHVEVLRGPVCNSRCTVHFSVKDSGIGISRGKLQHIFESFAQAESSITRKYGGTGLGLSISSDLVRLMGGHLGVQSEEGKGSTFHFTLELPVQEDRRGKRRTTDFSPASTALYTAKEGDRLHGEIIRRYLHSLGCSVAELQSLPAFPSKAAALFTIASPRHEKRLATFKSKHPDVPLVLVCDETQREKLRRVKGTVWNMVVLPVTASKIIAALRRVGSAPRGIGEERNSRELPAHFRGRALVAEDAPANQKLMKLMLEKLGMSVNIAANGREAAQMSGARRFDIVFMDINMPECDGIEATRMILEMEIKKSRAHTPIIALTAKAMKGDRESAVSAGMDDYLAKPVDFDSLSRMLRRYIKSAPVSAGAGKSNAGKYLDALSMKLGIGSDEAAAIIQTFLKEAPKHVKKMETACVKGDLKSLNFMAHKLKGSAANLRFGKLAGLSEKIEIASGGKKRIDYPAYVERIKKEIVRIIEYYKGRSGG